MFWNKKKAPVPLRDRKSLRELLEQSQGITRVIAPLNGEEISNYISIPLRDIPALSTKYVAAMETQETNEWCRCQWLIHPDDTEFLVAHCRLCGQHKNDDIHDYEHEFRGKRMRRGEQAPDCPVHTKEGFLIYFFQWVMDNADD